VLDETQATASADKEAAKPPEGFGTLPQEAVIRDLVTDKLTDDTAESLVSEKGREKLKSQLLVSIKKKTDVKVKEILFTDVAVQ
jgi:flagellar basal body-associated protein FliL